MPAAVTIPSLITKVRTRCRQTNTSGLFSDADLYSLILEGAYELYDLLIKARGAEYYSTVYGFNTEAAYATRDYALPQDFYRLVAIAMSETASAGQGATWVEPRRFNAGDLARQESLTPSCPSDLRYALTGTQGNSEEVASSAQIRFYPSPQHVWSVKVVYLPKLLEPGSGAGNTFDGINGWDTFLVAHACITVAGVQEEDVALWMAQKAEVRQRVESLAGDRDRAVPRQVTDRRGMLRGRTVPRMR